MRNAMIPEDEESNEEDEEDSDNEYHTEENAVAKRLKPYKAVNMQQQEESPVKEVINTSSHPQSNKKGLIQEIE